jgi:hypothetical protein
MFHLINLFTKRCYGHSENIILAMLFDERKYIRETGLLRIMKARADTKLKDICLVFHL